MRTVRPSSAGSDITRRACDIRAWPTISMSLGMRSARPGDRAGSADPATAAVSSGGCGRQVEEVDEQLGARDPVDRGVVDLADERDVAVVQALHDVDLPQGPGAVERHPDDGPRQVGQLAGAARRGEHVPADVVVEVEVGVLDPQRVVQPERHLHHPAPERRLAHQAVGHERLQVLERVRGRHRRRVDDRGDRDVEVHRRASRTRGTPSPDLTTVPSRILPGRRPPAPAPEECHHRCRRARVTCGHVRVVQREIGHAAGGKVR